MKSPFPGLDPFLEADWHDVYQSLVTYLCDAVQQQLPDDLIARMDLISDSNDVNKSGDDPDDGFIRIFQHADQTVITVVFVLSEMNKSRGRGMDTYRRTRDEYANAGIGVVEIDLLRWGESVRLVGLSKLPQKARTPYAICGRPRSESRIDVWAITVKDPLPALPIPLRKSDAPVVVDIQSLLDRCYKNGRYDRIDYRKEPVPPLQGDDAIWADQLLRAAGRR